MFVLYWVYGILLMLSGIDKHSPNQISGNNLQYLSMIVP